MSKKKDYTQLKQNAKELFLNSNISIVDIANTMGVQRQTVSKWSKQEKWEDLKRSMTITRSHLLAQAYAQLDAINREIKTEHNNVPTKALSDAIAVVMKQIETLADKPLHQYVEVCMEFVSWLTTSHPADVQAISEKVNEFIEMKNLKDGI